MKENEQIEKLEEAIREFNEWFANEDAKYRAAQREKLAKIRRELGI